jgi:PTH1 family peptidyl-tRNA hydrolase
MKLIIGLGNPEEKYISTRHNVGYKVLNAYGEQQITEFKLKDKFRAYLAELAVNGEKIILAKPTTYYNNVGESARLIADFYKIDAKDILIIHDELALPFDTIRTRIGGTDAGNNGIKSMNQHIGHETARIRIGIYNDLRDKVDDADFVLSNFSKDESDKLKSITEKVCSLIDAFIANEFSHTTV